ncbi:unnamed protein product [Lymnaea stagnalis]|uniref:Sulfotransferase domain-containing protein n=1 Tax=Lymnaea stagnalis TaxID=6523 RepID=A0AAV2H4W4_LYMST
MTRVTKMLKCPKSRQKSFVLLILIVGQFLVIGGILKHFVFIDTFDTTRDMNKGRNDKSLYVPTSNTTQRASTSTVEDDCHYNQSAPSMQFKAVYSLSQQVTPHFLPNYKNPCWMDGPGEQRLMCVPYVFLIGVPKCGTTDLYSRIVAHPMIVPPRLKEPNFLSRGVFWTNKCKQGAIYNITASCVIHQFAELYFQRASVDIRNNFKWSEESDRATVNSSYDAMVLYFKDKFKDEWKVIKENATRKIENPIIALDSSASYSWDNNYWELVAENTGCTEPAYLTSDLLAKVNPKAKIMMLMREPVSRAFSDYLYFQRRMNKEQSLDQFHNWTVNFITKFESCRRHNSLRYCTYVDVRFRTGVFDRARLELGLYHVHITEWFKRFPRDQFLFLRSETYSSDPVSTLRRVYDFLGVAQLSQEAMDAITNTTRINQTSRKKDLGNMWPETKTLLTKFYSEHIQKLSQLLGDDSFTWRDILDHNQSN